MSDPIIQVSPLLAQKNQIDIDCFRFRTPLLWWVTKNQRLLPAAYHFGVWCHYALNGLPYYYIGKLLNCFEIECGSGWMSPFCSFIHWNMWICGITASKIFYCNGFSACSANLTEQLYNIYFRLNVRLFSPVDILDIGAIWQKILLAETFFGIIFQALIIFGIIQMAE